MRVLVLGANGQLGSDLVRAAAAAGHDIVAHTRADADVTDGAALQSYIASAEADVVINTTAWTDLAGCEREPEKSYAVNAEGARNAAHGAVAAGSRFVQISTDYVFRGDKPVPYTEGDPRLGVNCYGSCKLSGEDLAVTECPDAAIVRVSGLYGVAGASGKGGNFVETMLRLAREGKPIRVVADQVTSPTYTEDVARRLVEMLREPVEGTYHLAAEGFCSWYEFACAIVELCGMDVAVEPTTAAEYGGPVQRPAMSALASERVAPLPPWRDGLERYLRAKGHISR